MNVVEILDKCAPRLVYVEVPDPLKSYLIKYDGKDKILTGWKRTGHVFQLNDDEDYNAQVECLAKLIIGHWKGPGSFRLSDEAGRQLWRYDA